MPGAADGRGWPEAPGAPDEPGATDGPAAPDGPGASGGVGAAAGADGPAVPGRGLIRLSWAGTAVFTVAAVATTVRPTAVQVPFMVVCVALFLVGTGAFGLAYLRAVGRSRHEAIGMGGLFFLAGCAPGPVRRALLGSFAAELVVAVVSASAGLVTVPAEADNVLAFGVLTPLYGLGLAGVWAARHGWFPPRAPEAATGHTRQRGVAGGSGGAD